VRIWEGDGMESRIEMQIAQRHAIAVEPLTAADLQRIYPGISPEIRRGMRIPGNAFTVSPLGLVQALHAQFLAGAGQAVHERVLKILPCGPEGFTLMTNMANRRFPRIVVAGGAWSGRLLDPLGLRVPLESERGYHALLPAPSIELPMPLSVKNRGFGMTPMAEGLRVTGTVEFAGLEAAPDERRAAALAAHARRIFPGLQAGEPRYWMGHRPSTPDSLPVLGEAPGHPGLYLAFGHGHFGLTGGPLSRRSTRLLTPSGDSERPGRRARPGIRYNARLCLPPARSHRTPPLPPWQASPRVQSPPKPRPLRAEAAPVSSCALPGPDEPGVNRSPVGHCFYFVKGR
jgi:D-amino-acid dehydrogenase